MSLLNDVLRDLQTRGAFGVEPLTGLEPVVEAPAHYRWPTLALPALAVFSMASATVLWQPESDGRWLASLARNTVDADMQPQSGIQTVAMSSPQSESDLAADDDPSRGVILVDETKVSSPAPFETEFVDVAVESQSAATESSAEAESPSAAADSVSATEESPPADLVGQYVVQLGAFADPANAAPLLDFLQQEGYPILTRSTNDAAGGTLTPVLAGPYADRTAALSARDALEADGWPGYVRVVADADMQPQSKLQAPAESSPHAEPELDASGAITATESAIEPATATNLRRDTSDAATAAARFVTRGLTAMRDNDLSSAERLFREALTIEPGDGAAWSYLYSALVRASKAPAAEQALRQGLTSARQPAPLAKLYARMLLDRGATDAAVSILRTHRPLPASDIEYDAFLAALLQQQGQYTEAGDIYRNLLTVEPGTGSWWIGLAMSYESLGNRPEALSAFQQALRAESLKTPLVRYARRRIEELQTHD